MAEVVHRTSGDRVLLRDSRNLLKKQIGAGSAFHLDASEVTITAANASDLATSLTLVNQTAAVFYGITSGPGIYPGHLNDTGDGFAHKVKDATNVRASAYPAVDLATAQTLANEIKTDYEAHRASTTFHYNADSTNTISASDASDQSSLNTLLNELKTDINAHMASAPTNVAPAIRLIDA